MALVESPATADTLTRLQRWYVSHCDDDWEHQYGVKIDTLEAARTSTCGLVGPDGRGTTLVLSAAFVALSMVFGHRSFY